MQFHGGGKKKQWGFPRDGRASHALRANICAFFFGRTKARDKAARNKAPGKLGQQLRQQKGLTDNEVNKQTNADAERERLIREGQEQLNYN